MQYTIPGSKFFGQELQKVEMSTALWETAFLTLLLTYVGCVLSDPRQLSYPTRLLLRPTVLWGGASSRVQALPAYTGQEIATSFSVFLMWLYVCLSLSVCPFVQSVQDFSVVFVKDGQTMTYVPHVAHEQSRRKPKWGHQSLVRPTHNICLNEKPSSILSSLPLFPSLFNRSSIELLAGSGESLVHYYIERWRH